MLNANKSAFLKPVDIYGVASCIGAQNVRCYSAPLVLQNLNLIELLVKQNLDAQWIKTILVDTDCQQSEKKYEIIRQICGELAEQIAASIHKDHLFINIGGDHSCAIGTWSGAADAMQSTGEIGLIWIDAHMDAHTPETSHSGAIHGMPLASLLGYGHPLLTQLVNPKPKLKPENICLMGIRSYEPEELALLKQLGVKIIFAEEIKQNGFAVTFQQALKHVKKHTCKFGISLDMDAIDPQDAPGVGSPENNGISAREMLTAFSNFEITNAFLGLELVELNAFEDENDKTARLALELISALFDGDDTNGNH